MAWSPPTPVFGEEPWRRERPLTPEETAPYLAELRALLGKLGAGEVVVRPVDAEANRRYLAACAARKSRE